MEYKIKKNNDKITIILANPKMIGLQELLNTIDMYNISLDDILHKIDLVSCGHSSSEEIGSEHAMIEISNNGAEIYDLYEGILDEDELFPTINISIAELRDIIELWKDEKEQT